MQHRPSIRAQHTRLTAWGDLFKIHKSQHDSIRLYLTMRLVGDARPNAKTRRRTGPRDCHTPSRMEKGLVLPRHSAVRPSLRGGEAVAEAATTRPHESTRATATCTRAPSKRCRLGCSCDESMLHLAQCPKTARLWSLLLSALQAFDEKTPPSQGDIYRWNAQSSLAYFTR